MSFVHVAIMVGILLAAMVASMLYYGARGKKQLKIQFDALAKVMGGQVEQQNRMHYPHWRTEFEGRPVEMFFHLSEGHRKTSDIVYLVISSPVKVASTTLVVEKDYFTTTPDKGSFNEVAGDYLADLMPGRYVYSTDENATKALFEEGELGQSLEPLKRYPNIVLGPDAITLGKPYGGAGDITEQRLRQDLGSLAGLATRLEAQTTHPAEPTLTS